jgi:hypothetical protein
MGGGLGSLFGGGIAGGGQGGISGPQAALGQWTTSQGELANAAQNASRGTGQGTMPTYADAGSTLAGALLDAQMSNADTSAMTNYNNQQKAQLSSGIGSLGSLLGGGGSGGSTSF